MTHTSIVHSRQTKRTISETQEAWGDRCVRELIIPPDHTAESYAQALRDAYNYSNLQWHVKDGTVIETSFVSIGD